MIIRKAIRSDAAALTDILNAVIAQGGTTAYQTPRTEDHFIQLIDQSDPKTFLYVAETDAGLQGMQWMVPLDPPKAHIGSIATFARPGTVQRGIGTQLFAITRQTSVAAGYLELYATIRADNTGGLAYYEKMGFRDHETEHAVPLTDGTPVDRITKRLIL